MLVSRKLSICTYILVHLSIVGVPVDKSGNRCPAYRRHDGLPVGPWPVVICSKHLPRLCIHARRQDSTTKRQNNRLRRCGLTSSLPHAAVGDAIGDVS